MIFFSEMIFGSWDRYFRSYKFSNHQSYEKPQNIGNLTTSIGPVFSETLIIIYFILAFAFNSHKCSVICEKTIECLSSQLYQGLTINYYSTVMSGSNSKKVQVAVRMRPVLNEFQDEPAWFADEKSKTIQSIPRKPQSLNESFTKKKHSEVFCNYGFNFDYVFGQEATTHQIFMQSCAKLVDAFIVGTNCTIFMYGQTTSGKTYTMLGDENYEGIISFSMRDIYSKLAKTSGKSKHIEISYLQIYNEQINDLLTPGAINLRIQEDPQGIQVQGLKQYRADNYREAELLLIQGEEQRSYKEKNIHDHSSRSHTIFQIKIVDQIGKVKNCLNLVDLAGSERLQDEDKSSQMNEETAYINKSLFVLSNVISKLSKSKRNTHVPFRDSKLTRLLSSSLNGNSLTMIICTLSPAAMNFCQTLSTLRFATNAKKVETKPVVVTDPQENTEKDKDIIERQFKHIDFLKEQNAKLKKIIQQQSHQLAGSTSTEKTTACCSGREMAQVSHLSNFKKQIQKILPRNIQNLSWHDKATNLCEQYLKNIDILQRKYKEALINIAQSEYPEYKITQQTVEKKKVCQLPMPSTTPIKKSNSLNSELIERIKRKDIFNDITVSAVLNTDYDEKVTISQLNVAFHEAKKSLLDRHSQVRRQITCASCPETIKSLEQLFCQKMEVLERAYREVYKCRGYCQ